MRPSDALRILRTVWRSAMYPAPDDPLTPAATAQRIQRGSEMMDGLRGVIAGYVADRNTAASTRELEDKIRRIPEVIACHYISGSGTFELQVMVTDLDAFSKFSLDVLLNLPHVKDLHTSFSLGEVKSGAALPLTHLGGKAAPPTRRRAQSTL